jgi:hypothetical protein
MKIFALFVIIFSIFLKICHVSQATSEMSQLTSLLHASTNATQLDDDLASGTASLNTASISALTDPLTEKVASEEARIQTLVRAFQRLPQSELDRYGDLKADLVANGDTPIQPNSKLANDLQIAWENRQSELKKAIESIVKPIDHMKNLLQNAVDINNIKQLIDLVDDVDNSRDFHTEGGVKILSQMINIKSSVSDEIRGLAAIALGNIMKHDYEQQLWILEEPNLLGDLVNLLKNGFEQSKRRSLYCISSAARGNTDVQEAILNYPEPFANILKIIFDESVDIQKKIFAFVMDMVEEYGYIAQQKSTSNLDNFLENSVANNENSSVKKQQLLDQLHALKPLGVEFCTSDWAKIALNWLQGYQKNLHNLDLELKVKNTAVATNAVNSLRGFHLSCQSSILSLTAEDRHVLTALLDWANNEGETTKQLAEDLNTFLISTKTSHVNEL